MVAPEIALVDPSAFDVDGPGTSEASIFGLPYSAAASSIVLLPIAWEATTSYGRGTAGGPEAIRSASPQLDLFDPELAELGLAEPWRYGIHMLPRDPTIEAWNAEAGPKAERVIASLSAGAQGVAEGDMAVVNALGRRLDDRARSLAKRWAEAGKLVGVVGGDHSVALGPILAALERHPDLGILHLDAHADLRVAYEGFERSHASVMFNVLQQLPATARLVQVGIRDLSAAEFELASADPRVRTFYGHTLRQRLDRGCPWSEMLDEIIASLPARVYVSLDIDVLDPPYCPSTGTPVPGGLTFGQLNSLLARLATSGRTIVGFDLVEVARSSSVGPMSEWDGNVGARVLYRLCGASLLSWLSRDGA